MAMSVLTTVCLPDRLIKPCMENQAKSAQTPACMSGLFVSGYAGDHARQKFDFGGHFVWGLYWNIYRYILPLSGH